MKLTNINQPITKLLSNKDALWWAEPLQCCMQDKWHEHTWELPSAHCKESLRLSGEALIRFTSSWDSEFFLKPMLLSLRKKNHYQAQNEPSFSLNKNLLSLNFATIKNQTFLMIKKDVFCLVTSTGQRKNSKSPWGIEPLTFKFYASMLYYWATETLQRARSITKFIWHASCILLGSAMIVNIESIQEGKKWSR